MGSQKVQLPRCRLPPFCLPGQTVQLIEEERRGRIAGGEGSVEDLLGPGNQGLRPVGGGKEAAPGIGKMRQRLIGQGQRRGQMRRVIVRPIELQKAQRRKHIVAQLGREEGRSFLIYDGPQALRLGGPGLRPQEGGQILRVAPVAPIVKDPGRLGQGHQHQAVPAGEQLGIRAQGAALRPIEAQPLPELLIALGQQVPALVEQQVGDARAVEVALGGDVVALAKVPPVVLAQDGLHLLRCEEIVLSLHALAVRVLAAVKATVRRAQLPQAVVQRGLGHLPVEGQTPLLPGLGIAEGQQGVVVQGLFKMRGQPLPVRGVAGKAAAQVVVDAAAVHLPQRVFHELPGFFVPAELGGAQQEEQLVRHGELGRRAEAAVLRVVGILQLPHGALQQALIRRRGRPRALLAQPGRELLPGFQEGGPIRFPFCRHGLQKGAQAHLSAPVLPREIGAGEEGLLLRRHQDRQRPASAAVEGRADRHIHRVHVRPLLPVHLHRHEVPVEDLGHRLILKGLPRHHVAPVAGGIADGEKHRLVLAAGPGKGLLAPRIPVHGIVRVLAEIERWLTLQMIAHSLYSFVRLSVYRRLVFGYT